MRNIVVSIGNGLLAEAITKMLNESDEFQPFCITANKKNNLVDQCKTLSAETVLAEVSYNSNTTINTRLAQAKEIRQKMPECKIVLLCDENSSPDIARDVMLSKKDGLIDALFYSSVTGKYLLAALSAL